MMDQSKDSMGFQWHGSQFVKVTIAFVISFVAIASLFSSSTGSLEGSPVVGQSAAPTNRTLIAYSVDYEMDKARGEKTVEHYGESMRPIVKQAIKNNENNPNSKDTAENTYRRESPLNDLLPERIGQFFSKEDLLDMRSTDDPQER
ncbi:hypothetical protein [Leptolyngbya sp. BC1307]|uniref:hypothetical protein n=1 Tax=Leptolyngbya sp. BC1307 TaxID=2029589 RepID=UPI00197FBD7F|nr:hypothetical protein [Leptolyngbya sp. BC1307]